MPRSDKAPKKTSYGTISLPAVVEPEAPTPEMTRELATLLLEGLPLPLCAAAIGIPATTLAMWLRQGQRTQDKDDPFVLFATAVARAEARGRLALMRSANTSPQEARKMLERLSPREMAPEVAAKRGAEAAAAGSASAPRSIIEMPAQAENMDAWKAAHGLG